MEMAAVNNHQLIQDFLQDCKLRQMSTHSIEGYGSSLHLFSKFITQHNYELTSIDKHILEKYLEHLQKQKISYKTMQNRYSSFISFYDYLIYNGKFTHNIVRDFRKRYLSKYKDDNGEQRKLVSTEQMAQFIHMIPDLRDKTIIVLFAKTGIRRRELVALDTDDINWEHMSITLKPTNKRSNRVVFFDYETALLLRRWLKKRELLANPENKALFVTYTNKKQRLNRNGVGNMFVKWATLAGLHTSYSYKLSDYFTPHCCRHWFTTHLRRAGMPREFIMELRGDKRNASMDTYYHIDYEELRKSYLGCIPQLGII